MKRVFIIGLALVVLVALVGGFAYFQYVMKPEMAKQAMAGQVPPPTKVAAVPAGTDSWIPELPAIGTVVAVQQVDITPQQGGLVSTISFKSGQDVEAGTVLVQINDAVEQSQLKSAEATLRDTQRDLERKRKLVQAGNTSRTIYDAAVAARDVASAEVEGARTLIEQKQVKAPFDGRLGIRSVDVGDFVSPGDKLVTLQQLDPVYVDFPMPEQKLGRLEVGQHVTIEVDAFPDTPFDGRIESIDARVDQTTRNIQIRAEVANPDKKLLPGMFADVVVSAGTPQRVVTVPRTAVTYSLQGDSILVVEPGKEKGADGKAPLMLSQRFVTVGESRGAEISILDGVKEGEQVVTQGQLKLQPGMPVTVDAGAAIKPPANRPRP